MRPNDSSGWPLRVHDPRSDDRRARQLAHRRNQAIDRAFGHDRVAVEKQHQLALGAGGCPALFADAKPTFELSVMTRTPGHRARTASTLPSRDALSTTTISCETCGGWSCRDCRQFSRSLLRVVADDDDRERRSCRRLERRQCLCAGARPRIAREHRRRRPRARVAGRPHRTADCSAPQSCRRCRLRGHTAPRHRRLRGRRRCRAAPTVRRSRAPRAEDGRSLRTPTAARMRVPAPYSSASSASDTYGRIDTCAAIPSAAAIAGRSSCGYVRLSPTISSRAPGGASQSA